MDFDLTDSQRELQGAAEAFAAKTLNDGVIERDRSGTFSRAGWDACAQYGAAGIPFPESFGGGGCDASTTCAIMEGLGYGCRDNGLLFSIHAHLWAVAMPIFLHGSDEQKRRHLPGLCAGKRIGAHAASEPDHGSDIFAMSTTATRDGDAYVLNGRKTWVTNAQIADLYIVYATVDPSAGLRGVTAFLVQSETPGMSVSGLIEKMGLRTSPMGEVVFEDCHVPAANVLGEPGGGGNVFNASMAWERGSILASSLGTMRRNLERCIEHARTRKHFGQAIGRFQSVAARIVDMKMRLETSRPLIYRIARRHEQGRSTMLEAAIAKLYVAQALIDTCADAIQVFGGLGYTTEMEIERDLRDAMAARIYSGTSEIQRNIIAGCLGL